MAELIRTNFFRMLPYLLPLLVAYFSGRYLLKTPFYKPESDTEENYSATLSLPQLVLRPLVIAILGWILLGAFSAWWLALSILLSFLIVDWFFFTKISYRFGTFALDLLIHITLLAAFSILIVLNQVMHFTISWYALFGKNYFTLMIGLIGFFLAVPVGAEVIGFLIEPFRKQLSSEKGIKTQAGPNTQEAVNTENSSTNSEQHHNEQEINKHQSNDSGFPNGGKVIGELERALIFLFILANQPEGIGFLLATKALFRFGDLKNKNIKDSEYYFIGTFYSFFYGILMAYLTKYFLSFF